MGFFGFTRRGTRGPKQVINLVIHLGNPGWKHLDCSIGQVRAARIGVRTHSAKMSLAGLLIAISARPRRAMAMQTAGSGPDSRSSATLATLPVAQVFTREISGKT